MSKKNEAWGIEVGAQAVKLIKLARTSGGVSLEDFEVLPFKHVLTTPDLNVDEAIRVNLESLSQKYEFEKSNVVVSVPGHLAFARFAKLPPIEASRVKSIVAYEAQQQIPFPIDEVEWDYHVFEEDDAPDIEVGIFAITKEKVAQFLSNYRSVGLRVDALTLSPVAVHNAFAFDNATDPEAGNSVYLDIGTVSTDIIVVESGGIWLRTLPLGGNHFTNALMKQFKISFAKAEKLKLEASTSKYAKQIFQAMRGVFSDLVSEIQRSLGFYQSLNRDADLTRIVGVGSTWKLPGLQKYLKQNLQMEVARPDGFSRLETDGRRAAEFSSVAVNMATAYGLALQGLGLSEVDANILPQSVLRQRMWKAKQPWFGAAAACVAGAAAIGPIMQFMAGAQFDSAWGGAERDVTQTIGEAQQLKTRYDNEVVANDPRPGIRNFRRSFDYANLYPKLMEDVAAAMATIQPDESLRDIDWNDPQDLARVAEKPRSERHMAWVTSVTTEYELPDNSEESGDAEFGAEPTYDEFGGGEFGYSEEYDFGYDAGVGAGGGQAEGLTPVPFPDVPQPSVDPYAEEGTEPEPLDPEKNPAPRIVVTVRGETTMNGSTISRELQEKFVGWMKQNAERPDRPYVLVIKKSDTLTDTRFISRGTTPETASVEGGLGGNKNDNLRKTPTPEDQLPSVGFGDQGLTPPGGLAPGGGLGQIDEDGFTTGSSSGPIEVQTPEGWYATLDSSDAGFSAASLLPRRPLSIEDNSEDVVFTFRFEILLLSPDQARKTILPASETPDAEPQDGEPQASTEDKNNPDDQSAKTPQTNAARNVGQEDQS